MTTLPALRNLALSHGSAAATVNGLAVTVVCRSDADGLPVLRWQVGERVTWSERRACEWVAESEQVAEVAYA